MIERQKLILTMDDSAKLHIVSSKPFQALKLSFDIQWNPAHISISTLHESFQYL